MNKLAYSKQTLTILILSRSTYTVGSNTSEINSKCLQTKRGEPWKTLSERGNFNKFYGKKQSELNVTVGIYSKIIEKLRRCRWQIFQLMKEKHSNMEKWFQVMISCKNCLTNYVTFNLTFVCSFIFREKKSIFFFFLSEVQLSMVHNLTSAFIGS